MTAVENGTVLKTGYYLDNFLFLLDFVSKRYSDILNADELVFIARFKSFNINARRLYVRLISRKGPYFVKEKIIYNEIKDLDKAISELVKNKYLQKNPEDDLGQLLQTLTKNELIPFITEYFPALKFEKNLPKLNIIEQLINSGEDDRIRAKLKLKWTFIVPCFVEYVQLFKLLFFGNNMQNLSAFILEDIGVLKYEPYKIREEDRWFRERELVDDLLYLNASSESLWLATENSDTEMVRQIGEILQGTDFHDDLKLKKEKQYTRIGQYFEKQNLLDEAYSYYSLASLPLARERKIRVLLKLGRTKEALDETELLLAGPSNENELEFATHFAIKLKRQLAYPNQIQKREHFSTEVICLKRQNSLKIEDQTLNYYLSRGFSGFFSENSIWTALFGLIFWDIIFMPVKGVFFNPFQRGPSDLFSVDFKIARKKQIAQRIKEISRNQDWKETLLKTYDEKYLTTNYMVPWKRVTKNQIQDLIEKVPPEHISHILNRMTNNLADFSSGFPDLLLFHPNNKEYLLIEVKGPGDQLRPNQKRWLRYFEEVQIPYKVARVKWL